MRRLSVKRSEPHGVAALRQPGRKLVLHVGCGPRSAAGLHQRFRGPEWQEVRLDIDPGVEPDIVASIVDMPDVEDESVDALWSSHNLEHVYAHQVPLVLGEFFRVLRPGGEALVTMPDLQAVARYVSTGKLEDRVYTSPAGPITALDMIFGHGPSVRDGNEFMAHRTAFSARTLTAKLSDAGFERIDVKREEFALWATAYKP